MVYKRLPLYAGFFVATEARGAKVVAAFLANLDTWTTRKGVRNTSLTVAGVVQSLRCVAEWSVAYLFVNFLRLPSARCIPKLCTIYNRISISAVCQSLFTMCTAQLQHTAHHFALCQSGCLAPICMCKARIHRAICYAAAATPIAETAS